MEVEGPAVWDDVGCDGDEVWAKGSSSESSDADDMSQFLGLPSTSKKVNLNEPLNPSRPLPRITTPCSQLSICVSGGSIRYEAKDRLWKLARKTNARASRYL